MARRPETPLEREQALLTTWERVTNCALHNTLETNEEFIQRMRREHRWVPTLVWRAEALAKSKLIRMMPVGHSGTKPGSPAPAKPTTPSAPAKKPSPAPKPAAGNPTKEHPQLLGDHTNGRIWIASDPLPGKDEKEWVDDGNGTHMGECVSLGKRRCPGLPRTKFFRPGAKVQGRTDIPVGTLIAAFVNGSDWDKYGHLAIYIGQSDAGLIIVDQYVKKEVGVTKNTLQWHKKNSGASVQSQGENYHVLVTIE